MSLSAAIKRLLSRRHSGDEDSHETDGIAGRDFADAGAEARATVASQSLGARLPGRF
jgi:hypothetical protein